MNRLARFHAIFVVIMIGAAKFSTAQSLTVVETAPSMNAFGVVTTSNVTITFNELIAAPKANDFYVYSNSLGVIAVNASTNSNKLTLTPLQPLRKGDVIAVGLAQTLKSASNNTLGSAVVFKFTVQSRVADVVPPLFTEIKIPPLDISNNSRAIQAADFDGDGDIDIVMAAEWMENDGQQNFSSHAFPENTYAFAMKVADIEHDGDMDVIIGSFNGVELLKNDGSMSFTSVGILEGTYVTNLSTADKNGDGLEDVLCSDQYNANSTKHLSWLVQNSDGTFSQEVIDDTSYFFDAVAVQMDGDNLVDIVAAGETALYLYHNDGSAYTQSVLATALNYPTFSAVDMDADQDVDLIVSGGPALLYLENTGGGNFNTHTLSTPNYYAPVALAVADFDGDGDPDIMGLQVYTLQLYENTGDNTFPARDIRDIGEEVVAGLSSDVDSDGDIDFVFQGYYGRIGWLKNTNLAEAVPFESVPLASVLPDNIDAAAWADYDMDGRQDLLVTSLNNSVAKAQLYHQTENNLELAVEFPGLLNGNCQWFDFESDGDLDFLISGRSDIITNASSTFIYLNTNGTFSKLEASSSLTGSFATAADLDGDRQQEIIVAGEQSGVYTFFDNTFTSAFAFESVYQDQSLTVSDIDNDGDLDFAATGWRGNDELGVLATIYINNGELKFTALPKAFPGIIGGSLLIEDLDMDGDADLASIGTHRSEDGWGNSYAYGSFLKNNEGNFIPWDIPVNGAFIYAGDGSTVAGDFNNDGYIDLTVQQNPVKIFLNDRTRWFTDPNYEFPQVSGGRVVKAVNFDNDGDLDFMAGQSIVRNNTNIQNQKPLPPTLLMDSVRNNFLYVYWTGASDAETPAIALTYQPFAGSSPTEQNILSSSANLTTGKQYIQRGGVARKQWKIKLSTGGDLYWGVQSIDAGISASAFSSTKTAHAIFIEGAGQSCTNTPQKYKALPSGDYTWTVKGGQVISSSSDQIEVVWDTEGYGTVGITDGASKNTLDIRIVTRPQPAITGPEIACEGSASNIYSTPFVSTHAYEWTIDGGTFLSRSDTTIAYVEWGSASEGKIKVYETSAEKVCVIERELIITKKQRPSPSISGEDQICVNDDLHSYSNATFTEGNSMFWTVFGGTIEGSATDEAIKVKWENQEIGRVTVIESNEFCSTRSTREISLTKMQMPDIRGNFIVCGASDVVNYQTRAIESYTYEWTVTGGRAVGSLTSNQISVRWQDADSKLLVKYSKGECSARDSVFVHVYPEVSKPSITVLSNNLFEASDGLSYQWNLDGVPLANHTEQLLTPATDGVYTVTIITALGCTLTSNELRFPVSNVTGMEVPEMLPVSLYPNPADDLFQLEIVNGYVGEIDIRLYNVVGELVFATKETKNEEHFSSRIFVGDFTGAFVIVEIQGANLISRQKLLMH